MDADLYKIWKAIDETKVLVDNHTERLQVLEELPNKIRYMERRLEELVNDVRDLERRVERR